MASRRGTSKGAWALVGIGGLLFAVLAHAQTPRTLRVDIQHAGNATQERYALERVVVEPLPWAGNPARPIDDSNRGVNRFEVIDKASGKVLYSRGYSTVFGEWRSTDEAKTVDRAFQESLRFPMPAAPVTVRVAARDKDNAFAPVWSVDVDPGAFDVVREQPPAPATPLKIHVSGPSERKVDLLIIGDGYTAADMGKFEADARRLSAHLFTVSPYKERADDFNVWGLALPTAESGVPRPSEGKNTPSSIGTRYDIFGSERYVLTLDNRALRELAQYAPNEFIEILVNNVTYGGGGIFGQFSTAAAGNDWADYLFVHEFGHHFAGLADEYYTSEVAYETGTLRPEPWEPNVTTLRDPARLKWRQDLTPGIAVPTTWPKAAFEAFQRDYQKERAALRKARRPESEMTALFERERASNDRLFSADPNYRAVGAFEGANYEAKGYYRSQMQCLMFDRSDELCEVCRQAVGTIIDLYSR
jgi:IgA Peptidase M64/Peptidase M64 N-terminus